MTVGDLHRSEVITETQHSKVALALCSRRDYPSLSFQVILLQLMGKAVTRHFPFVSAIMHNHYVPLSVTFCGINYMGFKSKSNRFTPYKSFSWTCFPVLVKKTIL